MKNLKNRLTFLLLFSALILGTISCISEQDEILEDNTILASRSLLDYLFYDDFESGTPFSKAHSTELGAPHSMTAVAAPGKSNNKAARFELNDDDPDVKRSKRAEVTIVKGSEGHIEKETWYGFDLYVPTDYKDESDEEVINQWFQSGTPPASIRIKDGRFRWRFLVDGVKQHIDLGKIEKGKWYNFTIYMIHSNGSDGVTKVWLDGKQVIDVTGKNINDGVLPKWKIGIYKSKWASQKTTVSQRVLYFDNVKVGDKTTVLEDMINTTSGTTTPTEPTTTNPDEAPSSENSKIQGLTFINTHINKEIYPLVNGGSVSMKEQGTFKISVRAEITSSKVQSVKFELTGAQNYTYVDKVKPFALFGDNGKGNYYYGIGMKEGNYKLKITTFSGPKATGEIFGVETVDFTVKK